jgi:hypothetical protein
MVNEKIILKTKNRHADLEISLQEMEDEYLKPFWEETKPSREKKLTREKNNEENIRIDEKKLVSKFLSTSCPCGENCGRLFCISEICESRENFRLMTWKEQQTYIVGILQTFMRCSAHTTSGRSSRLRARQKFDYFVNADRPVCRTMFLFYHGETIDRLKRHQKHLVERGTLPLDHGNLGRTPKHACKLEDKNKVSIFIKNFIATHGLPDPGRDLRTEKGKLKIYLPTVMDYSSVHRIYEKSIEVADKSIVKYQTFRRIWLDHFPHVVFSKQKSDLCITCEDNKKEINTSIAVGDEDEKLYALGAAQDHLIAAKKERDYYRECIAKARIDYEKGGFDKNTHREGSQMHYSWDFAQQIHIPYEDHQVGPIYFKSPRINQLFGVCCEVLPLQVNYLIDENDFIDKGSDTVISMLDHFFENHGLGEDHSFLTADNCVGQNKNNAMLQYLMYRVMTGKHQSINLSFMLVGHTKFAPDGYFGLIKKKYRRSKVYTHDQLVNIINNSTNSGYNECQKYKDTKGKVNFKFKRWTTWLNKTFVKLPGITNYQHFKIDSEKPGIVTAKRSVDSDEEEFLILQDSSYNFKENNTTPLSAPSKKMTAKRQWYLYDKIRPHIHSIEDKNTTAPKPKVDRPEKE